MSRGLGRVQRRVVEVLLQQQGFRGYKLPLRRLRKKVGGDASNVNRAVRTLERRGLVETHAGRDRRRVASLIVALDPSLAPIDPQTQALMREILRNY